MKGWSIADTEHYWHTDHEINISSVSLAVTASISHYVSCKCSVMFLALIGRKKHISQL